MWASRIVFWIGPMKRVTRSLVFVFVIAGAGSFSAVREAVGCPNCKEAVSASEGEVASMSSGYNWSVLFMLVVPFSMLGTGALVVRRAVKRGLLPEM
jgi:hypothetical protein